MSRRPRLATLPGVAFLTVVSLAGAPAAAAPVPVQGSFFFVLGTLPPVQLPVAASADVTGGNLNLSAGVVSTSGLFVPVTGFPLNLVTGLIVTVSNGAGSFAAPAVPEGGPAHVLGGGFGGKMPLLGVVQVKGVLALDVPLSVAGQGGSLSAGIVDGAPWTTGPARVVTTGAPMVLFQQAGTQMGALGDTSSLVMLVTPMHVNVSNLYRMPAFGVLQLHFVPEPGTLLLTAFGAAALAAFGGRRRR
jgi:hypothetical protein